MRLADVTSRVQDVSERYQVPEKVSAARQKLYQGVNVASDAAFRGANAAYRVARNNPRTAIAGMILAAVAVGGVLWYMFGDPKKPVERRRKGARVKAVTERRRRHASAR
jgi:hypothetical protein